MFITYVKHNKYWLPSIPELQNYEITHSLVPECHFYSHFPLKDIISPFLNREPYNPTSSFVMPFSRSALRKEADIFYDFSIIFSSGSCVIFCQNLYRINSKGMWCASGHSEKRETLISFLCRKIFNDKFLYLTEDSYHVPPYLGPQARWDPREVKHLKLGKISMNKSSPLQTVYRVSLSPANIASKPMFNYSSAFRYTTSSSRIFGHRLILE